jgi:hypothetical protein
MLAGLPVILGVQFLVAFLAYDTGAVPHRPIHKRLRPLPLPDASPASPPAAAETMADLPLSR